MKPDLRPVVKEVATKRVTNATSPRLLLLFSTLLVMMFADAAPEHAGASVVALLVAAVSTGFALFRPTVVPEGPWIRQAEWVLLLALMIASLILTSGLLAGPFAAVASPLWLTITATYTVLGLVGALCLTVRGRDVRWAFGLFLLAHAGLAVLLLRSAPPNTDVALFLRDGAAAVLHGQNPYAMTFPNIYPPKEAAYFYGNGVVINGRVTIGFPYLPVALLAAIPGHLLGDVRYSQLIAVLVTAVILYRLSSDRLGRAAAVLAVVAPTLVTILTKAWVEPTLVAILAGLVLLLERQRLRLAAVVLGLFLVSKQYVVIAIPVVWLIRHYLTRRLLLAALSLAAAVTLPFFLINPAAFWKAIAEYQLIQPFRPDSISLLVSSVNAIGWPPHWTYGVLPLVGGALAAVALAARAPRTPAAFSAGVGLTLLITILLSKQAFVNYYFPVGGAFLIAAVAWPTKSEGSESDQVRD